MKVSVIGCRGHVGYVFQSINDVPEADIVAVSSGSSDPVEPLLEMSVKAGFSPKVYDRWQQMIDETTPELLVVDGPFELHAAMSIYALERGINVFCEKPIALTLSDLAKVDNARKKGNARIISMVGLRYAPEFLHALELVRSGIIGNVRLIKAQKSYKLGSRPEFYRHAESYGGTIPWVGSHAFDWVMAFSGSTVDKVWATQSAKNNHDHGDLEVACQCMLVMKNLVQAQISIDYLRPAQAPTHGDDRVRVAGDKGIIEVSGGKITLLDENGFQEIKVPPAPRKIFSDFVNSLLGKTDCLVSDFETIALTEACLKARDGALNI